jgi:glycerol-3-phosphate O-acyltransferase/dihydroxyacetone phosphate acyltransferase
MPPILSSIMNKFWIRKSILVEAKLTQKKRAGFIRENIGYMFSWFLKFIVPPFTFRVFFRRIFYSNLKKVPLEKPLLFTGNHQNSFMDGVLVGSYLPEPINFLMRADMFKNPVARFCLNQLNVSPVYRLEEGLENVHKNLETFDYIYKILKKNGNYVVFVEGICIQEKRLGKLRKGTARMAFGAEELHGLDVYIVPVGVNYTYPAKFRKEVLINFDEPFSIRELKDIYKTSPARALLAFNERIEAGLKRQVIIVENPENDWIAEQLLVMGRNNFVLPFFRWMFDSDDRRQLEKNICDKINHLSKNSKESLESLAGKVKKYTDLLNKTCLKDENFARKLDYGFVRYISVILGLPLFIAGYLANLLPYLVPGIICNSLIKDLRFYSSVYIGLGTVIYLIYFPVVMALSIIFLGWWGILSGFAVPLSGYLVLFYKEVTAERFHTFRFWLKRVRNPKLIEEISALRSDIQSDLERIVIS